MIIYANHFDRAGIKAISKINLFCLLLPVSSLNTIVDN